MCLALVPAAIAHTYDRALPGLAAAGVFVRGGSFRKGVLQSVKIDGAFKN